MPASCDDTVDLMLADPSGGADTRELSRLDEVTRDRTGRRGLAIRRTDDHLVARLITPRVEHCAHAQLSTALAPLLAHRVQFLVGELERCVRVHAPDISHLASEGRSDPLVPTGKL